MFVDRKFIIFNGYNFELKSVFSCYYGSFRLILQNIGTSASEIIIDKCGLILFKISQNNNR